MRKCDDQLIQESYEITILMREANISDEIKRWIQGNIAPRARKIGSNVKVAVSLAMAIAGAGCIISPDQYRDPRLDDPTIPWSQNPGWKKSPSWPPPWKIPLGSHQKADPKTKL